jgi:hypothetical protein
VSTWNLVETVAEFPRRNARGGQWVRVAFVQFGARYFGDVRICFRTENTSELKATRQGLTLNYRSLLELYVALGKLLIAMTQRHGGVLADAPDLRSIEKQLARGDRIGFTRDDLDK